MGDETKKLNDAVHEILDYLNFDQSINWAGRASLMRARRTLEDFFSARAVDARPRENARCWKSRRRRRGEIAARNYRKRTWSLIGKPALSGTGLRNTLM